MKIKIRKGTVADMPVVLELFRELAVNKQKEDLFTLTVYDLLRDGFSSNPLFMTYVAELDNEIIGTALFYKSYTTMGKSFILEDIYTSRKYGNTGISLSLFAKFIEFADLKNSHRLEWTIIESNEDLMELHKKSGAKILMDTHIFENNFSSIETIIKTNSSFKNLKKGKIRDGRIDDLPAVLDLLKNNIKHKEKLKHLTVQNLISDGFGKEKYFHFFVAEFNDEVIGIVFFYHSYSTLVGKSLILETIIVKPKYHNKGFRKALIYKFYEFAYQQKIQRITQAINDKDIPIIKKSIKNGTYLLDGIRIVQIDDIALKTFIKNN